MNDLQRACLAAKAHGLREAHVKIESAEKVFHDIAMEERTAYQGMSQAKLAGTPAAKAKLEVSKSLLEISEWLNEVLIGVEEALKAYDNMPTEPPSNVIPLEKKT